MEKTEKYKVVKIIEKSGRKYRIASNLSLDEAKRIVQSFPNSQKSMVVFYKQ